MIVLILVGCDNHSSIGISKIDIKASEANELLGWLIEANPNLDAFEAISDGDERFYALKLHHRFSIPVYEDICTDWSEEKDNRNGVLSNAKFIEGAGYSENLMVSYEYRKFYTLAELYIREYNSQVLFHLEEKGSFDCGS